MSISFATQTVTRVRAAVTTDAYGNRVLNWDSPGVSRAPIDGCRVQPVDSSEYTIDSERITTRWWWRGPYDADLTGLDRIEHDGLTFSVDGDVTRHRSPTGFLDHAECFLRRVR